MPEKQETRMRVGVDLKGELAEAVVKGAREDHDRPLAPYCRILIEEALAARAAKA